VEYIGVSHNVVGCVLVVLGGSSYVSCAAVVTVYGVGCLMFSSCTVSNIGLCVSIYVSFICNLCLLILCMWYLCKVFFFFLFLYNVHSIKLPYICSMLSMCFEYFESLLLFLIACICS
jgi:hypothetical protein